MNIIVIPYRLTKPLPEFSQCLLKEIGDTFEASHPDDVRYDTDGLAKLRLEVLGNLGSPIGTDYVVKMTAYYAQLSYALTKLPVDVGLSFPWYPIFSNTVSSSLSLGGFPTAVPIALPNIHYERLSVLYNLAAIYTVIGVSGSRKDEEGLKSSIIAFQNAAGTLEHLLFLLPLLKPEPPALDPASPDLTPLAIKALRDICLAQAQEAFWMKACMNKLRNGTISKLAAKVSEYYAEAGVAAYEAKGGGGVWPLFSFPVDILNFLTIKKLHFAAAAQYRKSMDDLGANRYGDELGRLKVAEELLKKALEGSKKGVAPAVISDAKSLLGPVVDNLVRATKDNQFIYLEAVTPAAQLSLIVPAATVKPTIPLAVLNPIAHLHNREGGLGKPFFEALVPWEVNHAVKIYKDRKEVLLQDDFVGKKKELDAHAARVLQSLNLPGSIEAIQQPVTLPPSLLRKADEIRSEGGSARLHTIMQDVRKVSQVNQKLLAEAIDRLAVEETEDKQLRAQYGTNRWTRQPSHVAHSQLKTRTDHFGTILEDAVQSDGVVRAKYGDWAIQLALLSGDERSLVESIPTMATPNLRSDPTTVSQLTPVRDLRRALDELEDLQSIRTHTVQNSKYTFENDDIRPSILDRATSWSAARGGSEKVEMAIFEEVFEAGLSKFDTLQKAMQESESRQEDILNKIKTTNEVFIRSRQEDPRRKAREQALQDLDVAYGKYREIVTNLQEGLKFYSDLSRILSDLKEACKNWAYSRNVEARDQINALAHALDGVRLSVQAPGTYEAEKDGPIRFG